MGSKILYEQLTVQCHFKGSLSSPQTVTIIPTRLTSSPSLQFKPSLLFYYFLFILFYFPTFTSENGKVQKNRVSCFDFSYWPKSHNTWRHSNCNTFTRCEQPFLVSMTEKACAFLITCVCVVTLSLLVFRVWHLISSNDLSSTASTIYKISCVHFLQILTSNKFRWPLPFLGWSCLDGLSVLPC